jgi:alpha-N-arabinofuranosidase
VADEVAYGHQQSGVDSKRPKATIVIDWTSRGRHVGPDLLGVNHRFSRSAYGSWDWRHDRPPSRVVARLRRAGVTAIRFPGGKEANLYDWTESIGASRGCQVNGRVATNGGYYPAPRGTVYGIDEHMRLVHAVGAEAEIMVPFVINTPRSAANLVEYVNSPSRSSGNPRGGVDWADVRAQNGHPAPYDIRLWEVGNEQRFKYQRYWMSAKHHKALRQYVHGGSRRITGEPLGQSCSHPPAGVRSDGSANQVYNTLWPPVARGTVSIRVGHHRWHQVSDLADAGPDAKAYVLRPKTGQVVFGDGEHGAIPPRGATVTADYRSVHPGVFAFISAMRDVDATIDVCPSWGLPDFAAAARGRHYSCLTAHAYTHFIGDHHHNWSSPLEGHDWNMLGSDTERTFIASVQASLPKGVPVELSEFGVILGNNRVYPHWETSMTHALYMASQWIHWLRLGIDWTLGDNLTGQSGRGLVGRPPAFTLSAEGVTRRAIKPMFDSGGHLLPVQVRNNRLRNPGLGEGAYPGLVVAATRDAADHLNLMVVNRLPLNKDAIPTQIRVRGRPASYARIRQVDAATYRSWNSDHHPHAVHLRTSRRQLSGHSFHFTFPAHSITLLRLP